MRSIHPGFIILHFMILFGITFELSEICYTTHHIPECALLNSHVDQSYKCNKYQERLVRCKALHTKLWQFYQEYSSKVRVTIVFEADGQIPYPSLYLASQLVEITFKPGNGRLREPNSRIHLTPKRVSTSLDYRYCTGMIWLYWHPGNIVQLKLRCMKISSYPPYFQVDFKFDSIYESFHDYTNAHHLLMDKSMYMKLTG